MREANGRTYGPYYISSRRRGKRVVRRSAGSGPVAVLAAQLDEAERLEREEKATREREERERIEQDVAFLGALEEPCEVLVRAHLMAAGMHCRKGEWRRAREIRDY